MVESKCVYPLTIFSSNQHTENRLAEKGIFTVKDALNNPKEIELTIGINEAKNIINKINELLKYKRGF